MGQQTPLVLLCGASGTGVSTIAKKLYEDDPYSTDDDQTSRADSEVVALDLEANLCETYRGDKRIVNAPGVKPSMANVVMLPRDELYGKWNECCQELMTMHSQSASANLRLLTLHLTWYDSNTSEFFSPVDVRQLDNPCCSIDHVAIVIDDIFDMYCRLQQPGDLCSDMVITSKAMLLAGLRGLDSKVALVKPDRHFENKEKELERLTSARLRLEAKELSLGHLISWRRSEMIYAESIARALGARFTVLGAKHSIKALRELTASKTIPRTYLSHRISEVRRQNKNSSELPNMLGDWLPVVKEVNRLHFAFAEKKQLLINPTAIDELRFADRKQPEAPSASALAEDTQEPKDSLSATKDSVYRGRESAFLAARWELHEERDDLLWIGQTRQSNRSFVPVPDEHTLMFTENLTDVDETALSVTRSLEARIFEEVSFRDHVIVESTPHLCVYRPFFSPRTTEETNRVDWSGGVGPEIDHWAKKFEFRSEMDARVAFVHTTTEIKARIESLVSQGNNAQFLYHVQNMLQRLLVEWHVPDEVIAGFFQGTIVELRPTGLAQNRPNVVKDDPGQVLGWIRAAALVGLTEAFTRLKLRADDLPTSLRAESISVPSNSLGLFWVEEDEHGLAKDPADMATKLCDFFKGPSTSEVQEEDATDPEALRIDFWHVHDGIFEEITGNTLVEYVSRRNSYPYNDLMRATEQ